MTNEKSRVDGLFRRKAPFFISDFTDFFRGRLSQSLAAAVFLFFANVTSIITFGAVMERALHHQVVCLTNGWEFLPFRFWVGMWISVVLVILVATDMSALVGLITRFTEEAFATLISVVFIIQSFEKLVEISHDAPIITDPRYSLFL
uniref:Bicarbonate transporter-like transmembrane domain-containing protein n=1 Tax=Parascaris equorum TaxID=6256 RepID=A0A914RTK3_PAREQ